MLTPFVGCREQRGEKPQVEFYSEVSFSLNSMFTAVYVYETFGGQSIPQVSQVFKTKILSQLLYGEPLYEYIRPKIALRCKLFRCHPCVQFWEYLVVCPLQLFGSKLA